MPVADRPDRRADRLPALHARPHAGELRALVASHDPRRTGLGHLRRPQAGDRSLPRGLHHRERRGGAAVANQPVHQFLEIYKDIVPGWLALTLAVVLVVISQIKINVTNAYSGSLAWNNSFTRITKHYPGRLVFVVVNLLIALVLMEANMFDFL